MLAVEFINFNSISIEMEEINEENVLRPEKSVHLLVSSLQDFPESKGERTGETADAMMNALANRDYSWDAETNKLIYSLDTSKLDSTRPGLVRLLEHFKIDLKQLDFTERIVGLEHVRVRRILPEGKRAFFPLAGPFGFPGAGEVAFNRLNVYGDISSGYPTIEEQKRYLGKHLERYPDSGEPIDDINYFGFGGVGEHPGAMVYVHLRTRDVLAGAITE